MNISARILPIIVLSQFCCTSLWFAGNAIITDLVNYYNLPASSLGHLTSAVQFGFISGTLIFALLTIADRYSPSRVFFVSAVIGAFFNLAMMMEGNTLASLLSIRLLTGFFLAGIYPVGMKIAADYYEKGLGKSLGFLVGALVLGTAFPHLLKGYLHEWPWNKIVIITSCLAVVGGLLILLFVPDGPYRKPGNKTDVTAFFRVFKNPSFRSAAFGYFGHMWELYAFWTFVPVMLIIFLKNNPGTIFNISLLSFLVIGIGGLACIAGGYLSKYIGPKKPASIALFLSAACCLLSPIFIQAHSATLFIIFLLFWGMVVIADSPLFSTLVAQNAPAEAKGTALTIVNCIGFTITIISIQLLNYLQYVMNTVFIFQFLAVGPALGLMALYKKRNYFKLIKFRNDK